VVTSPGKRVVGTVKFRRKPICLTSEQVEKLLRQLPEETRSRKYPDQAPFWVRARFEFSWETGMRPEMVDVLRVPENYRRGATGLTLHAEDDKNRMARILPLSDRARAALDRVCPKKGVIFGSHDYREILRAVA